MTQAIYSSLTQKTIDRLSRQLGQGVLLYGPEGIGLGFAAHAIAASYTKEIITVTPDIKGTISIDSVRELYAMGRSKAGTTIFVIEDADAMGREAQNALLKLLEEPVPSVRFILTSHVPDRLLQTIRSRVGHYQLTPISTAQSTTLLDTLKVTDPTKRAQLMFIAEGLPAALTKYGTTPKAFTERSLTIRDARTFLQGTREDRLLLSAGYKDRTQAIALIHDMLKQLRRSVESSPKSNGTDSLDALLKTESALVENASVRLSLTSLALML